MINMNPKVDEFIRKADKWQKEFEKLRSLALECPLTEELKWGVPCYSYEGKNVVLIHGFKEYCAILFVKGALLKDPGGILITQTENSQSSRQIRFTNVQEIIDQEAAIKAYILEAIELERSGAKVAFKKTAEFAMPDEFKQKLADDTALKNAFEALTPGRQRAYLLFFAAPKQSQTRVSRIEKCAPQILVGKGLND